MRSWYEFGYDGFPTGEQRRRFYRQRDDPCDSEEERDYDDETNDRPIFYYPLRESEEGSRSSYDSGFSSSTSAASSDATDEEGHHAESSAVQREQQLHHHHASETVRGRRRRRRHTSRTASADAGVRCVLHSTLYEDMPAWFGATSVPLTTSAYVPATDMLTLQHGGAPRATPLAVSNQVSLWHWSPGATTPSPSQGHGNSLGKDEAGGSLRCARVRDDVALLEQVRWDRLHPVLRIARSSATRLPARIGHAAVGLPTLDSSLLQYFLTEQQHFRRGATASSTGIANAESGPNQQDGSGASDVPLDLLVDPTVELHGSLIVGGTTQLVDAAGCGGVACGRPSTSSPSSPSLRGSNGNGSSGSSSPFRPEPADATAFDLDGTVIPHTCLLSHPALCVTLLAKDDGAVPPAALAATTTASPPRLRHHTVVLPLDTPSMSVAAPRAFATLTPWADASAEAAAVRSFAYLGGTENGRDPLAFLELEVFRLHLETWSWSCSPVTTYGAKPAPRFGHTANLVDDGRYLVLFGGVGVGHAYLNDLHVLDVRTRVWREVFLPFDLEVPRRAFHMSAVLSDDTPASRLVRKSDCPASSSSSAAAPPAMMRPPLSAFTSEARTALFGKDDDMFASSDRSERGGTTVDFATRRTANDDARNRIDGNNNSNPISEIVGVNGGDADDEAYDDGDVWSSSVTTARSPCTLVLLGGESDGGRPVAASWACALRNGKWKQLSYPCRTLPHFYHVARSASDSSTTGGAAPHPRRHLSRTDFRVAVESLVDRTARASLGALGTSLPLAVGDSAYMPACHGSLGQLLVCPRTARGAERLLLMGGSRGPPVSIATQLEVMGSRLQDAASLWILAVAQQQQQQQQGCQLSAELQRRVPHLPYFLFHANGTLARAAGSVLCADTAELGRQHRPLSAADARSNRLISESVLDGQMTEWMRLARKRLRDAE